MLREFLRWLAPNAEENFETSMAAPEDAGGEAVHEEEKKEPSRDHTSSTTEKDVVECD